MPVNPQPAAINALDVWLDGALEPIAGQAIVNQQVFQNPFHQQFFANPPPPIVDDAEQELQPVEYYEPVSVAKTLVKNQFKLKANSALAEDMPQRYLEHWEYLGLLKDEKLKWFKRPFDPRLVGVEVEVEKIVDGANNFRAHAWMITQDGSLKEDGVELISVPMGGKQLGYAMDELEKFFAKYKAASFSHRCSIHVHVDVRDLSTDQLWALVLSYICLEDLFFSEVHPLRQNCTYCLNLADANIKKKDVTSKENHGNLKYFALNFGTCSTYGTVEFRHHGGTKDVAELVKWIELCQKFVEYFAKSKLDDIVKFIHTLNSTSMYEAFIREIFGVNPWPDKNLQEMMQRNVTIAKRLSK